MSSLRLRLAHLGWWLSAATLLAAMLAASSVSAQDLAPAPDGSAVVAARSAPPRYATSWGGVDTARYPSQHLAALRSELTAAQAQLARYSLAVPILIIVLGVPVASVGGFFFFGSILSLALDTEADNVEQIVALGGIVMLTGWAIVAVGLVMSFSRAAARRPFGARIKAIKRELADYGVLASVDVAPCAGGAVVTTRFAF